MIKVKNLHKKFDDLMVLDGIDEHISQGEVVVIIGPSGSGKSTFLRCLNLLEDVTEGEIYVDDELINTPKVNINVVRQKMGMVFQQFNLFPHLTIMDNITLAPVLLKKMTKEEAVRKGQELLERVNLAEKADAYPAQLSGGQKQRVAIARAMATNPKVLLCDEATSALDPNTTKQILGLLKQINREMGVTVIVITHEMSVIEAICDRVAIIDQSHIAEAGKVSDIFSNPKTPIGRQLILGDAAKKVALGTERRLRIIFDGRESSEPVSSNLVLACKVPINIMHAETKDVGGKAMGHMLIQIPEDETEANRVINYLKTVKVAFEEVR